MRRVRRAALRPAVAERRVLDEPVAVGVRRRREAPGLLDRRPRRAQVRQVAGHREVLGVRDHVERRRVRRLVRVLVVREPRHERRRLRDLVRDLAVRALELPQEVEPRAGGLEVAVRQHGRHRPERVAPEVPGEAGPFAVARRAEAGDEAGAEQRVLDEPLVDPGLRPGERVVEPRVGRLDAHRPLREAAVVRDVPFVERARVRQHAVVGRLGVVAPRDAARQHDRQQVRARRVLGHRHLEAQRHVARLLLVRHDRQVARAGTADDRREALRLLRDRVDALLLVPARVARHQPGGPHELETRTERADHGQRQRALDVEQHGDRRLVQRREDRLPDRERRMRVGEDRRLRAHVDPNGRIRPVDVERIALQTEGQLEVLDELQRVRPDLHRAVLVPERRRPPPRHVEEAPGAGRPVELEAAPGWVESTHPAGRLGRQRRRRDEERPADRRSEPHRAPPL